MVQSEVVNKISMEMALALGDLNYLKTCRYYIQMAIVIGTEHFTKDSEEIIAMDFEGVEVGRFKSTREAGKKLGIDRGNIQHVVNGTKHSAGGLLFMKVKDKVMIKRGFEVIKDNG